MALKVTTTTDTGARVQIVADGGRITATPTASKYKVKQVAKATGATKGNRRDGK
jgi:hypothetical protein